MAGGLQNGPGPHRHARSGTTAAVFRLSHRAVQNLYFCPGGSPGRVIWSALCAAGWHHYAKPDRRAAVAGGGCLGSDRWPRHPHWGTPWGGGYQRRSQPVDGLLPRVVADYPGWAVRGGGDPVPRWAGWYPAPAPAACTTSAHPVLRAPCASFGSLCRDCVGGGP